MVRYQTGGVKDWVSVDRIGWYRPMKNPGRIPRLTEIQDLIRTGRKK